MMKVSVIRLLRAAASIRSIGIRAAVPPKRKAPSALELKDGVRVFVLLNDLEVSGTFRGAAPDGSFAVLLDDGRLMAFDSVVLGD